MTLHFLHINHEIITFMPKTCQGLRCILSQKRKICISSDLLSILTIFLLLICYYELLSSILPDQTGRKIVKMFKTFNGFCRKTV